MSRILLALVALFLTTRVSAESVEARMERLYRQASSGEIRFQKLVQPSKDSLSAMGEIAATHLVSKLTTTDAREKHTLVDIYRGIGKVSTPYLVAALETTNRDQMKTASRCLAEVKDSTAIPALATITNHTNFTVRMEAATAIAKSGRGEQTAKILVPLVSDTIDIVRKCAVYGLGTSKHVPVQQTLLLALDDPSFAVRLAAYDALALHDSLAHNAIASALANAGSGRQKVLLARLCGQLSIDAAHDRIVALTSDTDPLIRGWAVWSLSRMQASSTMQMIKSLRESENDLFVLSQIEVALEYLASSKSDE